MGFFDDVVHAVDSAVGTNFGGNNSGGLLDTAFNSIKEVTQSAIFNPISSAADSFNRSDIGKVANVAAQPILTPLEVAKDLSKGNVVKAVTRVGSAGLNLNPVNQIIGSSKSISNYLKSDSGNNLTLGWGRDAADSVDILNKGATGGKITGVDAGILGRNTVKSVVYGTSLGYLASSSLGSSAANYAIKNPLAALAVADKLSKGNYNEVAGSIANNYLPGSGTIVRDVLNGGVQNPSPRAPSSTQNGLYGDGLPVDQSPFLGGAIASIDPKIKIAIGLFVAMLGFLLIKRLK